MDRLAEDGAVVAFPEAILRLGSGYVWDQGRDLGFLAALIESLVQEYPVAPAGVVISGMSGGARMACLVASMRADLVLAVGAVAGLRAPAQPTLARPIPVIAFHGLADRVNPYAGGARREWQENVGAAAAAWAAANGAEDRSESDAAPGVKRTAYGAPGSPGEVVLFAIGGAGHTWPGGHLGLLGTLFLGRTSRAVDATGSIWRCALAHSAPR
jgi:polyhydroxybutyrate depolymerase